MTKHFYITTPIYYVNDTPHIGHAYTTVVADVLTRYHKLFGDQTYFLTGTDEHGQKVENAAKNRNVGTQEHVDQMVVRFQEIWKEMQIEYDFFIRTTMDFHKSCVQQALQKLYDQGEIYSDEYEGWYSVSEEIFYTEKDLVNGKSPTGKEVTKVTEKNYFFKMSAYQERLLNYINENPSFIQPDGKRSEVLGFLQSPLADLCISRPKARLSWGIELPFDKEYVTYVWFDALLNYTSAIGLYAEDSKKELFQKFWPQAIHLIGKDILMTHAVYWPTMLMALELPLPKQIFAHGWWLNHDGGKMSKSEGPVVAPLDMKNIVGVDAFRYFLTRDIVLGNDAAFSKELVINRVNAELANNLGNLASRSLNLVDKFFAGCVPEAGKEDAAAAELKKGALSLAAKVRDRIEKMQPQAALGEIIEVLNLCNKYIDERAPWKLAKEDLSSTGTVLYNALETLRICAVLLSPVMPDKMRLLLISIGAGETVGFDSACVWGGLKSGSNIIKGDPLFPRISEK